ncbi:hypothetical protein OU560_18065, partial [Escherichia coli]|nr:hypothetical protein [Escherichia coli]
QLYQNGITSSVEGVETDINASTTRPASVTAENRRWLDKKNHDSWGNNQVRKGARRLPCVAIYFLVSRGNTSVAIKRHIQKNIH